MSIRVEFYGIPRRRAGVEATELEATTLGDVFRQLISHYPALKDVCTPDGRLKSGYLVNLNGQSFTTEPGTAIRDGDVVLLLSADVGG